MMRELKQRTQDSESAVDGNRAQPETHLASEIFPWPLSRFEQTIAGEQAAVNRFIQTAHETQEQEARASSDGAVRRAVHAKGHGLIAGNFHVHEPANADYRVGLFQKRATYKVLLRPSNGATGVRSDVGRDAHGLAMRVLLSKTDLEQSGLALMVTPETRYPFGHDFVLMDEPSFFVPNIDALAELFAIIREEDPWQKAVNAVSLLSRQDDPLRVIALLAKTFTRRLKHPLATVFHSASPYALGADYVVKYSVEPANPQRFAQLAAPADADSLRSALAASLREEPIELKFFIHALSPRMVPRGHGSLAHVVENATLDWSALGAVKVQVASIELPLQDPTTTESLQAAESFHFNPWHALEAHRPLGSLNRARLSAYRASQRFRSGSPGSGVPDAAQ